MTPQHFGESFSATGPENYERFFVAAIAKPVADDLIQRAALRPGERVLDVGCGTGVVTRMAAERVGAGGSVAGLDVNPGMLAVARSVTPAEPAIDWHEASAEAIPLPDGAVDVVLCQMSLQFVEDRAAAVREMHRVLASGGRLVLNLPGPSGPIFDVLAEAMGRHIAPPAAGFVRQVFALHDPAEIQGLLEDAGFHDVSVRADTRELTLPAPKDFLWQYIYSTPLAAVVADAAAAARAALESEVLAGWRDFEENGGTRLRQDMTTATARR